MGDHETRPRPQYGEYATPEEQLARIKDISAHPFSAELHTIRPGAYGESSNGASPADAAGPPNRSQLTAPEQFAPPERTGPTHTVPRHPAVRQPSSARAVDRVATLALLALGLYSVLSTIVTMTDLAGYLNDTMQQIGVGTYAATPLTGVIALIISVVNVVLWLVSAVLSARSMRAGRVSFWIPLTAGVLVTLVTATCYGVLLMNDPSFVQYVMRGA